MSVQSEITLKDKLATAKAARDLATQARETEREMVCRFIHEARRQHWSWQSIGDRLGISDNAVKLYYKRNRMKLTVVRGESNADRGSGDVPDDGGGSGLPRTAAGGRSPSRP